MPSFADNAARFVDWFKRAALPLWIARAYDEQRGGFFEALDVKGAPALGGVRRARVQARQIYAFASAGARWPEFSKALDLSHRGFAVYLSRAFPDGPAGGCVHLLDDDGAIIDDRRDLYDQAFALLAASARLRLGDEEAARLAAGLVRFLDGALASPHGGWREDDRGSTPRRQNPHMHLFEAFMALAQTGATGFSEQAKACRALFDRIFWDNDAKVLREFFTADWRPDPKCGDVVEPGHMMEWVWLLKLHEKAGGADAAETQRALFQRARTLGADPSGFLKDELRLGAEAAAYTRRLWPQTEYLKAALALAGAGEAEALEIANGLIERLFETYLDHPVAGLWRDQYDAKGEPIAADTPASILYHLYEAVVETEDALAALG